MKKNPLLIILIISSLLVTIPGIALNTGLLKTQESYNYSPEKIGAASTIHEIKTLTSLLYTRLTQNRSSQIVEEALEKDLLEGPPPMPSSSLSSPVPDAPPLQAEALPDNEDFPGDTPSEDGQVPLYEDTAEGTDELSEEQSGDIASDESVSDNAPQENPGQEIPPMPPIDNGDTTNPVWQTVDDGYFLDACFIGDSRTKGFGMYSGLTTTTYAKVGLQLYKVFDDRVVDTVNGKLTVPEALAVGPQFGKIYLMFGLNEMGWGNDELFMQHYYNLIDTIKALQPGAIIYVQQIIHVTKNKAAASPVFANEKINHRNELLRKVAADEHVYYIELNEVFTDEEGNLPEGTSFDGVHISGAAMQLWKEYLKTHAITADTPMFPPIVQPESQVSENM